jgi:hypothetical protein
MPFPRSLRLLLAAVLFICIGVALWSPSIEGAENQGANPANQPDRVGIADSDLLKQPGSRDQRTETTSDLTAADANAATEAEVETAQFLIGQVLDPNYEPVEGAWVISGTEAEPVLTAEDGTFELPLNKPFDGDNGRSLVAWKEGFGLAQKYVRQQQGVLILLKKDELKEVRILDKDSGLPVVDAKVQVLVEVDSETGNGFFDLRRFANLPMIIDTTDGDGKIKIPDPKVSERYTLEVEKEGYDRRLINWWSLRNIEEIHMARPEEVRMQFVRKDGSPHAGAQVCFPQYRKTITLDEEGWGTLPSEARWGFWVVQLLDENTQWVFVQVEDNQIQDGASLSTDYFTRSGQLFVQGDEKASAFEIATSAVWSGWGDSYLPDPIWGEQENLVWTAINDKGEFKIDHGWQGKEVVLHVRRTGAKGVLLSERVLGAGPYELSLAAAATLKATVACARPELLEGASLKFVGNQTDHEATVSLTEGFVEVRLPADKFDVILMLPEIPHDLPLGELQIIGMDLEHTFYFEGIRTISGSVRAGGEKIFPCEVILTDENNFWTRVDVDPQGHWELKGAPTGEIALRLKPENKWLAPVDDFNYTMQVGQTVQDIDLPVATLVLSAGNIPLDLIDKIRISRQKLPEPVLDGRRNRWYGSSRPKMPDLSNGPVEILLSPSVVNFQSGQSKLPLGETSLKIREGEVRAFEIRAVTTSLVSVRIEGFSERLWGNFQLSPVQVPGLLDYPSFRPQPGASQNLAGQLGQSMHVLPGVWKVTLHAPFWSSEYRTQVGEGKLEFELDLQSDWEEVWLRLNKNGKLERSGR